MHSLNTDHLVIPIFATDIKVPIQDIKENGTGSAKKINNKILDALRSFKVSPHKSYIINDCTFFTIVNQLNFTLCLFSAYNQCVFAVAQKTSNFTYLVMVTHVSFKSF